MKKILFWILTFLWIWLSFCSAWDTSIDISLCDSQCLFTNWENWEFILNYSISSDSYLLWSSKDTYWNMWYWNDYIYSFFTSSTLPKNWNTFVCFFLYNADSCSWSSQWWWSSTSDIDVYYNNWNSVENITCDWTQAISINWLSTITSTNTFTPYYNISYKDEDNQSLIEFYSKSNLYLSGWLFKKTYTWDNERILTDTIESPNSSFSWYLPSFDITWSVDPNDEFTWNVFNNFADNSLKVLLSNIPSYIQYVILIALLFFILGFIRKFKRR